MPMLTMLSNLVFDNLKQFFKLPKRLISADPQQRGNHFKNILFCICFQRANIALFCFYCSRYPKFDNIIQQGIYIVASYVIDPHMFSVPNFYSRLPRNCASCTGDRSNTVYSRSAFLSGLIMLRMKFPVVGYAQTFIK